MLWEVEIRPTGADTERDRLREEFSLLTHRPPEELGLEQSTRGYLVEGDITKDQAASLLSELLLDPLVETGRLSALGQTGACADAARTVLLKPGVMDPVALSVVGAARDLGMKIDSAATFRRYYFKPTSSNGADNVIAKILANDAIERIVPGPLTVDHLSLGFPYSFRLSILRLRELGDSDLERLSRDGGLALSLVEMHAIRDHFRALDKDPTDVELETIAQTWSEHCSHKTLKGQIDFGGRRIRNLLKETIFAATQQIRDRLGAGDWCVSVFEDNAGVVRFTEDYHVCFKVETHNHPSAIEPYGGANTGLGGVIRDPLGTGLGATPICNTDVFCFASPDTPSESLPPGVLHPRRTMKGVVTGVRDYGNRVGIPTVNGAVCFDERYLANPLVFCGTVGLIPVNRTSKESLPGDRIVLVGGRTGRDGIHGATFSSLELTEQSEDVSGGAVQIGNPITEKKLLDVILQARDLGLYHSITDCGAGGLSSAVGEMAAKLGAEVHLERVPLKYAGLSYTEIWISESQERMVLAVAPDSWPALAGLFASEDVEATDIGSFDASGQLRLFYEGNRVADLDLHFLHEGRPHIVRPAQVPERPRPDTGVPPRAASGSAPNFTQDLIKILSSYNVCSKEWIIRQYDHEVRGGTVLKPLVGVANDGPGDAAVVAPVLKDYTGLAIGCGINPRYGDVDAYWMAAGTVDEAIRNVVAVGADPERITLLDNFCWGNTDRPEVLGSLIQAAEGCRDAALAYGTPFISGKDSLNNEYRAGEQRISIPPTLLISALGRVADVRRCVSMDLKDPGNLLFLVGATRDEMAGSHYHLVNELAGGSVPTVDFGTAPRLFQRLYEAIRRGLVRSCHDLSEGGMAVAIAEMAFAGGVGADITNPKGSSASSEDEVLLFSESPSRFIVEIKPADAGAFTDVFGEALPAAPIGKTCLEPRLRIAGKRGEWIVWASLAELKEAWQKPLRW